MRQPVAAARRVLSILGALALLTASPAALASPAPLAAAETHFDDAIVPPEPPGGWPAPVDLSGGFGLGRDGGERIDVMVVYTPQARSDAGGVAQIEAKIQNGIGAANDALGNSGASPRLRLVHTAEVSYGESFNALVDLDRLQQPSDGFADEVHAWRNTYGADLVGMTVAGLEPGVGGIGYLMTPETPLFEAWAFSVVTLDAVDTLTLAHELGHNMGLAHDEANAEAPGSYSYSYGYRVAGSFRTVMAYPCYYQGLPSCPRVAHYSNPAVPYSGSPTGVVEVADNALTLQGTAVTVANFRQSVGGDVPPIVSAGPDVQIGVGSVFSRVGTFSDDGPGPWTGTVDYGESAGDPEALALEGMSFTLQHTYSLPGAYVVTACVTGEGAAVGCDFVMVTVATGGGALTVPGDAVGFFDPSTGLWHVPAGGAILEFYFGNPGDVPFVGDWDCDGDADPGLYRQSDGFVYLRTSHTQGAADTAFYFGNPGDVPLPGDFDGDGCDTVSIYRPSEGRFYIQNELGSQGKGLGPADYVFYFGDPLDIPFAGDFDGDGSDEVGLHRQATGSAYLRLELGAGPADIAFYYGNPGDEIFAGDWTGDGTDTVGLYRPGTGWVYLNYQNGGGVADESSPAIATGAPVAGRFD